MAELRAFLFGSKLKILVTVFGILAAVIGGAYAVGVVGVPSVASIDNTFGNVTDEVTVVNSDLVITNPNPVGLNAQSVRVEYTILMNGIDMANGTKKGVSIGTGNTSIPLSTRLQNAAIPEWWASHIRNGEHTVVEIDATVTSDRFGRSTDVEFSHDVETDLVGAFNSNETRPVNADHPLTDDPILFINETRGRWGEVDSERAPIDMVFVVFNPNLEPYSITGLEYEITMNEIAVGEGTIRETYVIGPGQTEAIEATTVIQNDRLDEWWVSHLDDGTNGHQISVMRIEFSAHIELPSGESIEVPLDALTYTETIETDVFDEGLGEADDRRDRSETDGSSSESTGSDSEEGSSDEPTSDGDGTGGSDGSEDGTDDGTDENETDDGGDGADDDGIGLPLSDHVA